MHVSLVTQPTTEKPRQSDPRQQMDRQGWLHGGDEARAIDTNYFRHEVPHFPVARPIIMGGRGAVGLAPFGGAQERRHFRRLLMEDQRHDVLFERAIERGREIGDA